jgi:ribosomal protein S18 acetylase RimI-like enzyme
MVAEDISIRPGTHQDIQFLQEMLFEAAFWRPDQEQPSLEIGLARPDLLLLMEGWGRDGDTAVIAINQDEQRVGAAWYRFWEPEHHSYGYVSPEIPELAIAVRGSHRRIGVGHLLVDAILKTAADNGIVKVSLSVEVDNPALKLYLGHGFKKIAQVENAWTMVAQTIHKD